MEKIVIVGGGAGGLELATRLGRKLGKCNKAEIHLVDASPSHIWKPLLHEVATGSLDTGIDEVSYRGHAQKNHFHFHLGRMCGLDRQARTITIAPLTDDQGEVIKPERTLPYDTLVMALGSQTNDFGTPGAREHCAFLDRREEAERFHKRLISTFLRLSQDARRTEDVLLRVAIVGAGATGVELSAELYNTINSLEAYGINLGPENLKVTLIEAGDRILPALPPRISAAVVRELRALGVDVRTGVRITEVTEEGLRTADGELIPASIKVWAAGVKAPDFLRELDGLEVNRINQIMVQPTLQSTVDEHIFAIGDCAACPQPDGKWVPPRAQAAHQQADHLYRNLLRRMKGKPMLPYVYHDHGSLVSLSRYSTVGSLMGNLTGKSMIVEGRIARVVYISLYRLHQKALFGFWRMLLIVLASRINRVIRPRLKLH
ncbi:NAD(P)/FAD-dependent oxidoreductase [Hahella sp. SMD15-11]|uniref:NAD(P)/FAD-dependent oxidoreductase n=1 Tax=Thermohahella caldifontis TaxID=3142973 RepID=A0AB39UUF4_9GAMM